MKRPVKRIMSATQRIQRIEQLANKRSAVAQKKSEGAKFADFLRGSYVSKVSYSVDKDTLSITFINDDQGKSVVTETSEVSTMLDDKSWKEVAAGVAKKTAHQKADRPPQLKIAGARK